MGIRLPPTKQICSLTEVQFVTYNRLIMKMSCDADVILIISVVDCIFHIKDKQRSYTTVKSASSIIFQQQLTFQAKLRVFKLERE